MRALFTSPRSPLSARKRGEFHGKTTMSQDGSISDDEEARRRPIQAVAAIGLPTGRRGHRLA